MDQRYQSLSLGPAAPLTLDKAAALVDAGLAPAGDTPGMREGGAPPLATQTVATRDDVDRLPRTRGLPIPACFVFHDGEQSPPHLRAA